jgi:hypothetical protein
MAGVRRRTKYRKSTLKSVTDELPEPAEDEYIAMALGSRGSNIFEVRSTSRIPSLVFISRQKQNRFAYRTIQMDCVCYRQNIENLCGLSEACF